MRAGLVRLPARNRVYSDEVPDQVVQACLDVGFTKRDILDVTLGYSPKVMSNHTHHFANTPVDEPMQRFCWQRAA